MKIELKKENGFSYVDEGKGPIILILHGLFGALSNFRSVIGEFRKKYRVIIPSLPIYEKSKFKPTVEGLTEYLSAFVKFKGLNKFSLLGNSLGGHIALIYSLTYPEKVTSLTLTASSGLYESGMGSTFPKRGSYEFIRERVAYTFYSPKTATKELVDEVYKIVNDNFAALRILRFARSAQNHNMREDLVNIKPPTCLIWGLNDNITPPRVAHEFDRLIPDTELHFLDECGHAPMMEQDETFNTIFHQFLVKHQAVPTIE